MRATRLIRFKLTLSFSIFTVFYTSIGWSGESIEEQWIQMIESEFPKGCVFKINGTLLAVGNNGFRTSGWLVESCEGSFEYWTSYLPPGVRPEEKRMDMGRGEKLSASSLEQLKKKYSLK